MKTFTYYVVWQRKGNFTLDDAIIQVASSIATENGIAEAKQAVAEKAGYSSSFGNDNIILVKWTRLD